MGKKRNKKGTVRKEDSYVSKGHIHQQNHDQGRERSGAHADNWSIDSVERSDSLIAMKACAQLCIPPILPVNFPAFHCHPHTHTPVSRWKWAGVGRQVGGLVDSIFSPLGSICAADETLSFACSVAPCLVRHHPFSLLIPWALMTF